MQLGHGRGSGARRAPYVLRCSSWSHRRARPEEYQFLVGQRQDFIAPKMVRMQEDHPLHWSMHQKPMSACRRTRRRSVGELIKRKYV